ncbi:MAG: hypothetical protein KZQ76_14630 [Candidatus Thiodiazotropha sp. (ex Epidulcina cf. delphinae)]|nr:hypothetical protein [Candidatus Thiodiazotropha sp. (ex Epidulcina cf. delphinae)]
MIMIATQQNGKTKQKGNATVETILIATVMAPLLGGIPLLGKIADINNNTAQSSRYLAWEQTVAGPSRKTAAQLQTEVGNRFFAKPDLHIRTDRGALSADEYDNPMWTGYGYNEEDEVNRLVTLGNGLTTHIVNEEPQSLAGRLSSGIERIGRTMARFSGGEWDIEAKGLYTATVSIDVVSNKYLPSGVNCNHQESEDTTVCVSRSNSIFVDSWEAGNADHAEARARTFVPAGALEGVGNAVAGIAGAVPFFADIRTLRADGNGGFGYVNAEVLPLDRYADD